MSALVANFKTLYQRRALVWVTVIMGLISLSQIPLLIHSPQGGDGRFSFLALLCFMSGFFVGLLALEVRRCPLAWCLPRQVREARRFVGLFGMGLSLMFSLVYLLYRPPYVAAPDFTDYAYSYVLLSVWMVSAFFMHLGVYALGVCASSVSKSSSNWIGFLPLLVMLSLYLEIHRAIEWLVIQHPLLVIVVSLVLVVWGGRWWGGAVLSRRVCAQKIFCFMDSWNTRKVRAFQQERLARKTQKSSRVDAYTQQLFLRTMTHWPVLSLGRHVMSSLYSRYGALPAGWKALPAMLVFFVLFLGFFRNHGGVLVILMLSLVATQMTVLSNRSLLMPVSRQQEYPCVWVNAFVLALLTTGFVALLVGLSYLVNPFIPPLTVKGQPITFEVVPIWTIAIPLLVQPWAYCLRLVIRNMVICNMVVIFLAVFIGSFFQRSMLSLRLDLELPLLYQSLLAWIIYAVAVRYICLKRSFGTS